MACVGTGKIKEPAGLREPLEIALARADIPEGVMRILSQEASGRIGIRQGRIIVGAQISANGVSGYDALKAFLSLKRGMFYYLEAEEAGGIADLDQQLSVDLDVLLSQGSDVAGLLAQYLAMAELNGWQLSESLPPPRPVKPIPQEGPGSPGFGDTFLDKIAETARSTFSNLKSLGRKKEEEEEKPAHDQVFADLENALSRSIATAPVAPPLDHHPQMVARPVAPPLERLHSPVSGSAVPPAPAAGAVPEMPGRQQAGDQEAYMPEQASPPSMPEAGGQAGNGYRELDVAAEQWAEHSSDDIWDEQAPAGHEPPVPPEPPLPAVQAAPDPLAAWPREAPAEDAPAQQDGQAPLSVEELLRGPRSGQATSSKFAKPSRDAAERARFAAERSSESQKLRMIDIADEIEDASGSTPKPAAKVKRAPGRLTVDFATIGGAVITVGLLVVCVLAFKTTSEMANTSPLVDQAKKYIAQKKPDLAVTKLTLALDKNPDDVQALLMRGGIYESEGDLQHAGQDYDAIMAKQPDDDQAVLRCALTRLRLGDLQAVLPLSAKLLSKNKDNPDGLALQGIALAGLGKYDAALESLNNTNETKLTTVLRACVNGARGCCYMHTKQPQKGARCYQTAIEIDPKNDGLYRERAACFEQLGEYDKAIGDLQNATRVAPANATNFVDLARLCQQQKRYQDAVKAYKDAITLTPRPLDLYLRLAGVYMKLGQYGDATNQAELALKLTPRNREAEAIIAEAEQKQKSAKPVSIADMGVTVSHESEGDDGSADAQKAIIDMQTGKYGDAEKLLTESIRKHPSSIEAVTLLARTLLYEHKNQAAYEQLCYLDSVKQLPLQDRFAFADCATIVGHPEKTVSILNDCVTAKPTWVEARVRLIKALIAAGQVDRARTVAEEGCLLTGNLDEKQKYLDAMATAKKLR